MSTSSAEKDPASSQSAASAHAPSSSSLLLRGIGCGAQMVLERNLGAVGQGGIDTEDEDTQVYPMEQPTSVAAAAVLN